MIITQEIFEAFLHCPTKSHLFCRPDISDATPSQERRPEEDSFQQSGSSRLHASVPDHEVYTGTPTAETIKRKIYRMILDYTALGLRPPEKVFLKHCHFKMFWAILSHAGLSSPPCPSAQTDRKSTRLNSSHLG